MSEGRLSLKLVMSFYDIEVSEFICDVIAYFEGVGKILTFDKLAESSATLRIGGVDLTLVGSSGGLLRTELIMDNVNLLGNFAEFMNVYRRLLSLFPVGAVKVRNSELICVYETYIPLSHTQVDKYLNIPEVLRNYGIVVNEVNSETLDGVELINVIGTYVVAGLGIVKVIHTTLSRNYAVRCSLTMYKNVSIDDVSESTIKKLTYESQMLAQAVNEELYYSGFLR